MTDLPNLHGHVQDVSTLSSADTVVDHYPSPTTSKLKGASASAAKPKNEIIPPASPRHLILCFDGTGDRFDETNSNVVHLVSMLHKGDQSNQLVYYHSGLGTSTPLPFPTPIRWLINSCHDILDEAFAFSVRRHVLDGYEYIMQHHTVGDRISLFGFSRGAYTARALAGMLYKVGLLQPGNLQQVLFAYEQYMDLNAWDTCIEFKKTFCTDVDIEFVGVWDTVASLGVTVKKLPFTSSTTSVRTFRQAISLDERRVMFQNNPWNRPTPKEATLGFQHERVVNTALTELEREWPPKDPNKETDFEDVFFAGCHCDVGGGSVPNDTPDSLARVPLRWMIRECFKTKSGIMFDAAKLREVGLDPDRLYPEVSKRPERLPVGSAKVQNIPPPGKPPKVAHDSTQSEEAHELNDALSPAFDQLEAKWGWWLLDHLPIGKSYQNADDVWVTTNRPNMGQGRIIRLKPNDPFRVHRSVQIRMEAEYAGVHGKKYKPGEKGAPGTKYKPESQFPKEPLWVD